ncbi:sigma factor-like helix-turn-helix DNA-binding protein [Paenibacillus xylanexedens]|uniref:sigma factor-like helix-turn-helix DNA-binding protein n=1 Tax=Paenibacillus xylanexedens TaxID=528191 RepID=UPI0016423A15|nr:sigma factor-like helix-turn-helix DNA-binding protein [Paenibacillus xylanexedens]
MDKNELTQLLNDFRSYEYAVNNCGPINDDEVLPYVISERMRDKDTWDRVRYNRIVTLIQGAVNNVLNDEQRAVIMKKYLDRNTMTLDQIAAATQKDPSRVSRLHTEAIRKLAIALEPLSEKEREIHNIDYMFEMQKKRMKSA